MKRFLITYDLEETAPNLHGAFIVAAERESLLYVCMADEELFRLPNTTVWGIFSDSTAARDAFDRAKVAASGALGSTINLEKRAITALTDWRVLSDRRKSPEAKWTGSNELQTCRKHQVSDPYFRY